MFGRRIRMPAILFFSWILAGSMIITGMRPAHADATLNTHPVRLDASGKLLSWVPQQDDAYATVAGLAWNYLLTKVPVADENGQPAYLSHSYLDPSTQQPVGWPHNPAGLYAMLIESALRYYQFSGNAKVLTVAETVADHELSSGMTKASDSWSLVPYASGDSGSLTYGGSSQGDTSGSGDGTGVIEPDKIGEFGHGLIQLYKLTGKAAYLTAAENGADALVKHQRTGSATQSPWPFRVVASNNVVKEQYTASVTGSLELFDDLIALGVGDTAGYQKARAALWTWTMTYPMANDNWSAYFEDVEFRTDPGDNLNQLDAMMFARYLLLHPSADPQWQVHVRHLIAWVEDEFAAPSEGGATAIQEQKVFPYRMGSHTSRYAEVNALLYEKTGDTTAEEKAYRSFNWATYMARSNGVVIDGPEVNNQWFTDGYADYIRHFMVGMGAMPQDAPSGETHLLETTSEVTKISYGTTLEYTTYDASGTEKIKTAQTPIAVTVDGSDLPTGTAAGSWSYDAATQVLIVRRASGRSVVIDFDGTAPTPTPTPTPAPSSSPTASPSTPPAGTLPVGWRTTDVGDVGVPGSETVSAGAGGTTVTMKASGVDIWGAADSFRFGYHALTGDGSIAARVVSQQDTDEWALAGVMVRSSLDPASPEVLLATTPGHGLSFDHRDTADADTDYAEAGTAAPPTWVGLARTGNLVIAYNSTDGKDWTEVGRATVALGSTVLVGVAATSHVNTTLGTDVFDHISGPTDMAGDTNPPVITDVASGSVNVNGGSIGWSTDEPATSQVEYGTGTGYGTKTAINGSLVTTHLQVVAGLLAGTTYHYRVISADADGNTATSPDHTFVTGGTAVPVDPTGLPVAAEGFAPRVVAVSCATKAAPGTAELGALLVKTYRDTSVSDTPTCAATPSSEYYDGRALNWKVSVHSAKQAKEATAFMGWLLATDRHGVVAARARRLGVVSIVWNNRVWHSYAAGKGWGPYDVCSRLPRADHDARCRRDHLELDLSWEGANGRTSQWTKRVASRDYGPCRVAGLSWAASYRTGRGTPCPSYRAPAVPKKASATYRTVLKYSGLTVQRGSKGAAVAVVQTMVGLHPRATFDAKTVAALKTWQGRHKVSRTGVMDTVTWRAFLKSTRP